MPDHTTAPRPAAEPARLAAALVALLLALGCIASCGVWGLAIWRSAHAPAPPAPAAARWQEFARTAPRLFPSAQRGVAAPTRYRLWGVIGGGTRAGAALIGVGGGTPHAYKVGADVEAGVRLVETSFGRAVLLRDGVRETLATSPGTGSPGAARQGRAAAPPGAGAYAAPGGPTPRYAGPQESAESTVIGSPGSESAAAEAAAMRAAAQGSR
jgi:general secretion pathway protein C